MSYGQSSTSNEPPNKTPEPLYILNSNIIGNGLISSLDQKNIKDLVIYREKTAPNSLQNLASTGIIAINYNGDINSKSFTEIGLQHGLNGPLVFILNGHKLDAAQIATLRIVPQAIGQLNIKLATAKSPETVINIQLAKSKTNSKNNPPGTIMIR